MFLKVLSCSNVIKIYVPEFLLKTACDFDMHGWIIVSRIDQDVVTT